MKTRTVFAMVVVVCTVLFTLAVPASAEQKTVTKNYQDTNGFFVIQFDYDDSWCSRPLTNPIGVPHYTAKITVFRVANGKKVPMCEPWFGTFTDGKCYEDNPADIVARARSVSESATNITAVAVVRETNNSDVITSVVTLTPISSYTFPYTNAALELKSSDAYMDKAIRVIREQCDMTNLVRKLAESGDICAVLGHKWEILPNLTLLYDPNRLGTRRCGICGLTQRQRVGAWE